MSALLHGPEQIADLPVPVAESPGAVRIGHPERCHRHREVSNLLRAVQQRQMRARTNDEIMPAWCRQTGD